MPSISSTRSTGQDNQPEPRGSGSVSSFGETYSSGSAKTIESLSSQVSKANQIIEEQAQVIEKLITRLQQVGITGVCVNPHLLSIATVTATVNKNLKPKKTLHGRPSCLSCQSTTDLEEDQDNPGEYYCASCWENYETDPTSSSSSVGRPNATTLLTCKNKESTRPVPPVLPTTTSVRACSDSNVFEQQYGSRSKPPIGGAGLARTPPIQAKSVELTSESCPSNKLWIMHDNPQLANNKLKREQGKEPILCWVETKDPNHPNAVRVLIGEIDFCGPIPGGSCMTADRNDISEGSECIRLDNLKAYLVNYDTIETRINECKVTEIKLDRQIELDINQGPKDFLKACTSSVSVIFDPQSSHTRGWYPYKDQDGGKIPPHFRSKGMGYLKLGDDMGQNGLCFLSNDACKTFFLKKARNVATVTKDATKSCNVGPDKLKSVIGTKSRSSEIPELKRKNDLKSTFDAEKDDHSCSSKGSTCTTDEKLSELQKNIEALRLEDEDAGPGWKEKRDLLLSISNAVINYGLEDEQADYLGDTLAIVNILLTSKNHLQVKKSAIEAIGILGTKAKRDMTCSAWRSIMVELLKALGDKQSYSQAAQVLADLHGSWYTISTCGVVVTQALKAGRSQSALPVKIMEWLNVTMEIEMAGSDRYEPVIDQKTLKNLNDCFLARAVHRDPSCRAAVYNGIANCICFGIQKLGMKDTDAAAMCKSLSSSNVAAEQKAWKEIMKKVKGKVGPKFFSRMSM